MRRFTERRRIEREIQIAPLRDKSALMQARLRASIGTVDDATFESDLNAALIDEARAAEVRLILAERVLFELKEWFPAWIKWGITKIDGFTVDDETGSVEQFCELGDRIDLEEAYRIIQEASELPDAAKKNLESPGTSAPAEDGSLPNSTVTPAA